MNIIPYEIDESFLYYLQQSKLLKIEDIKELFHKINNLFHIEEYHGYKQALFLSYLLYVLGDETRMMVIIERLAAMKETGYVPLVFEDFLLTWLGKMPEADLPDVYHTIFKEKLLPGFKKLDQQLTEKSEDFVTILKESFEEFYHSIEDELILDEMEIHSDELIDNDLESRALRWEYKYLGREDTEIKKRREIYLKRQSEWLK